jgi:hypothetical protein
MLIAERSSRSLLTALYSLRQCLQFNFWQKLQFHPAFDRQGVHWKPVLPDAEAYANFAGGGIG